MLAAFARTEVSRRCPKKQKKSNDQGHPATRYYLINKPRSLDMKNYLVTGGLSSVTKPFNKVVCYFHANSSNLSEPI